tara:strand:+ start:597 stop:986 length:390 start_codon:yes stop_codon:yes gene_type:complete
MRNFINKILDVEKIVSKKYGSFNLFALFERDDLKDRYDIVISLDLKERRKNEIFQAIHEELSKILDDNEMTKFSRFVYLSPTDPFVLNINMAANIEHSSMEINNTTFNSVKISHAFILTSKISAKNLAN